jgi:hypothetical protein
MSVPLIIADDPVAMPGTATIANASIAITAKFLIVSPLPYFNLNLTTLHLYLYVLVFFSHFK